MASRGTSRDPLLPPYKFHGNPCLPFAFKRENLTYVNMILSETAGSPLGIRVSHGNYLACRQDTVGTRDISIWISREFRVTDPTGTHDKSVEFP